MPEARGTVPPANSVQTDMDGDLEQAAAVEQRSQENLVIGAVLVAGLVAVGLVSLWSLSWDTPDYVFRPEQLWPYLLLAFVAMLSEIAYVPIVHNEGGEELTFFEILVIAGVLLFAPVTAMVLPLIGFVLAQVLLRRPIRKAMFNLGSYALASAALVAIYGSRAIDVNRFGLEWILLLILGALAFAIVNLVLVAWILKVAEGFSFRELVKEQWRLSIIMALLSTAVAAIGVEVWVSAPWMALLLAPLVLGLWNAYKADAERNEAKLRSDRLVLFMDTLSRISSDEAEQEWQNQAIGELRNVFDAPVATIVTATGSVRQDENGLAELHGTNAELEHCTRQVEWSSYQAQKIPEDMLPEGWTLGYGARIDLSAQSAGLFIIGSTQVQGNLSRRLRSDAQGRPTVWRIRGDEENALSVLTGVVASLGKAMQARSNLRDLETEKEKLDAVVTGATDGFVLVDTAGTIQRWSPAMEAITGYSFEDLMSLPAAIELGNAFVQLVPAQSSEEAARLPESALTITRNDGEVRELSVEVSRAAIEARVGSESAENMSVLTVRDTTRERRIERMKSDFIATVSHELKTPITPIKGYSQLLLTRWDRLDQEKRERMLQTMLERSEHLSRLVEDLLIASRVSELETTKLDIRSTEIHLSDIVNDVSAASPELVDRLTVSGPDAPVFCDRQRAVQCLSNLVSNAKKYSESDTEILIRTEVPTGDEFASIAVTDSGLGIPADEVGRVFEQFYRVEDPMTMTTGGTGLGLYISRTLARAMGGDISVESVFGEGSTFKLSLPRTQVNEGETA
ncbi:MAG: PAS domain-containing sensor histidine kinase [Actinomycetia bacterium]|nr:PAS domain-containing sensor histidine kinase [Actinomycetes bacterium]MCH9800115.1 PAS domain-containing sensor histidine kinase [Actinomycetes bacterium]